MLHSILERFRQSFLVFCCWLIRSQHRETFYGVCHTTHLTFTKSSIFGLSAIFLCVFLMDPENFLWYWWKTFRLFFSSWVRSDFVSLCHWGETLLTPDRGHTPSGLTCQTSRSGSVSSCVSVLCCLCIVSVPQKHDAERQKKKRLASFIRVQVSSPQQVIKTPTHYHLTSKCHSRSSYPSAEEGTSNEGWRV